VVEVEHERDVLEHHPTHRVRTAHKIEHMPDEPRIPAADPSSASRLAQVLTWEAGSDEIHRIWERLEIADVRLNLDAGEPLPQNGLSEWIDLAEELRRMPSPTEA
jgi:hypothetical protein